MKLIFFLLLCFAALLPAAFSEMQNNQNYGPILDVPRRRGGKELDTLAGHTFGTSKRYFRYPKKNFDEIDSAGFNGFSKRNFDEIDSAGFNGFSKRNFDEIDSAGFNGFSKRNFDEIDNAGFKDYLRKRNFDEIDAAGFNDFSKRADSKAADAGKVKQELFAMMDKPKRGDVKGKRNFDEIDAAGFNDFSKRSNDEYHPDGYKPAYYDDIDHKYKPINAFLYGLKHKIHYDLSPYYEEYKNRKYNEDTPYYDYHHPLSKRRNEVEKYDGIPPYYPPYYYEKYDEMLPYYLPYYNPKQGDHPPYYPYYYPPYYPPTMPEKSYTPTYSPSFLKSVNYYKPKNLGGADHHPTQHLYEPTYYRRVDYKPGDYKHKSDHQTTDLKTQP